MRKYILIVFIVLLLCPGLSFGITAREIMAKSQEAFLYPGKDMKIRVEMRLISSSGKVRLRELTMLRKNFGPPGGQQKYFIYFHRPADVKGMTFMVYKYPQRDDDRWLFIPALNMVRRIAARDKTSSFVGSDFTYEDVSGRDIDDDRHDLVKEESVDGRDCFVVKSIPKKQDVNYSYKLSWIDKESFLPLKEEYYDLSGNLYRVFTAEEIKDIQGIPTVTKRRMRNVQSGHQTEVVFKEVSYDIGLTDRLFTERFLKMPPRRWIK